MLIEHHCSGAQSTSSKISPPNQHELHGSHVGRLSHQTTITVGNQLPLLYYHVEPILGSKIGPLHTSAADAGVLHVIDTWVGHRCCGTRVAGRTDVLNICAMVKIDEILEMQ